MDLACETHEGQLMSRPYIYPDLFSGEGSFSQWIKHFESAAAINHWDDETEVEVAARASNCQGSRGTHTGKRKFIPTSYKVFANDLSHL